MKKAVSLLVIGLLALSMFPLLTFEAKAVTVFSDGFESGDFSAWTNTDVHGGNTLEVQSNTRHHGTYGAHCVLLAWTNWAVARKSVSLQATLYARMYVQFTTFGQDSTWVALMQYRNYIGGNIIASVITHKEGGIVKWGIRYISSGTTYTTTLLSSPTPSSDTWYSIGLKTVVSGTVGEVRFYLDGEEKLSATDLDNDQYGNIGAVYTGLQTPAQPNSVEMYWDCVVVSDSQIGLEGLPPQADVGIQTTGVDYAHEGDTITYEFTVTNYGSSTAYNVQVSDDIMGDLTGKLPDTTLNVNEVNIFTVIYVVPTPSGYITNTVTVTSSTSDPNSANNQLNWTVDVLHPDLSVSKSGPSYAYEGDTIPYTITVSNIGDCELYGVIVTDSLLGPIWTGDLNTGVTMTFTVSYTVPTSTPSGDLTNTVTAVGSDTLGNQVTDSASWTVTVVPRSLVTDSTLGYFDVNGTRLGQQFRLILTQESTNTFTLKASNPGQIYYNVFYIGTAESTITLDIGIPYPFVTQGSEPIHVYSLVTTSGGCFVPSGELFGFTTAGTNTRTPSGALGINLTDYSPQAFGSFVTIHITGKVPSSTLVYVTIHLDYGLKGTSGYGKNINNDAINPTTSAIKIPNLGSYILSVGGAMSDSQTIQNENVFKRDPGIAGLVLNVDGTPLQGVQVNIYNSNGKLLVTLYTDRDGWYQWLYKYTGKPTTFTVKVPRYNLRTTVIFKANGFIEVDFQLPNRVTVYSKWN